MKNPFKAFGRRTKTVVTAPARAITKGVDVVKMKVAMAVVRHALTGAGGYFVTTGVVSGEQLEAVVGAVVLIIGIVASGVEKYRAAKALAVAKASPAEV